MIKKSDKEEYNMRKENEQSDFCHQCQASTPKNMFGECIICASCLRGTCSL